MTAPELDEDLPALLAIAEDAAGRAARVHAEGMGSKLSVTAKSSPTDIVPEVDRRAEAVLVEAIRSARPEDGILGEEGTAIVGATDVRWVLDPLDGTTNYVYGYPAHAVSVGVEIAGRRVLGVVCDSARSRVYKGIVGRGADCDGAALRIRSEVDPSLALLGTGFLPDARVRALQAALLAKLASRFRDVRRSGSAAIDLCLVASGALDVYYEFGLGHWDFAGGAAIAEAAGATVLELEPIALPAPLIVAGNATLVASLRELLVELGAIKSSG